MADFEGLMQAAGEQWQVFTAKQADAYGVDEQRRRRLERDGMIQRLHRGVFAPTSAAVTLERDLMAAVFAGGQDAWASARAAAQMRGLPGGDPHLVEVSCRRWRRTRAAGLVVHERQLVGPGDVTLVRGIPCSSVELNLIEIAAYVGERVAERFFHAARRERRATYASFEATLLRHARRGTPGIQRTRRILERYVPEAAPTESEKETELLEALRRHGFPEPDTQVVVHAPDGRFVGRADFGYRDRRVVLQYHSSMYHELEVDIEKDESQRNGYLAAEWLPVIARKHDLRAGGHEFAAALAAAFRLTDANLRQLAVRRTGP